MMLVYFAYWIYCRWPCGLGFWDGIPNQVIVNSSSFSKAKAVCTITPVTKFRIPVTLGPGFSSPRNWSLRIWSVWQRRDDGMNHTYPIYPLIPTPILYYISVLYILFPKNLVLSPRGSVRTTVFFSPGGWTLMDASGVLEIWRQTLTPQKKL